MRSEYSVPGGAQEKSEVLDENQIRNILSVIRQCFFRRIDKVAIRPQTSEGPIGDFDDNIEHEGKDGVLQLPLFRCLRRWIEPKRSITPIVAMGRA